DLIPEGYGARPHREYIAEDPTDSGGGSLVRLDERRMVVALDPEGSQPPVSQVDDAGILPRTHDHPGSLRGETAQMDPGGLVGAVLGPHDRIHGQFGRRRLPAQDLEDAVEL